MFPFCYKNNLPLQMVSQQKNNKKLLFYDVISFSVKLHLQNCLEEDFARKFISSASLSSELYHIYGMLFIYGAEYIHLWCINNYPSQNDLLQLFQPFGVITKLVMLRAKNQVSSSFLFLDDQRLAIKYASSLS